MKLNDLKKPLTANALNESLAKTFGTRIALDKFTFLLFVLPLFACFSFPIQCQKLNTFSFVVFSDRNPIGRSG